MGEFGAGAAVGRYASAPGVQHVLPIRRELGVVGLHQWLVALQQALVHTVAPWFVEHFVEEKRRLVLGKVGRQVAHQRAQHAQRLGMKVDEVRGFREARQVKAAVPGQVFFGEHAYPDVVPGDAEHHFALGA